MYVQDLRNKKRVKRTLNNRSFATRPIIFNLSPNGDLIRRILSSMFQRTMQHDLKWGPIRFNALKHHAHFIRTFIRITSPEDLPQALIPIGHSQMDLYTGDLSPEAIMQETDRHLTQAGVGDSYSYLQWIKAVNGFHQVVLSDTSHWILRAGTGNAHYVHLHPGRYSPFTIRVAANTLKTAVALCIWLHHGKADTVDRDTINRVRALLPGLSPLRQFRAGGSLDKVLALLLRDKQ